MYRPEGSSYAVLFVLAGMSMHFTKAVWNFAISSAVPTVTRT